MLDRLDILESGCFQFRYVIFSKKLRLTFFLFYSLDTTGSLVWDIDLVRIEKLFDPTIFLFFLHFQNFNISKIEIYTFFSPNAREEIWSKNVLLA